MRLVSYHFKLPPIPSSYPNWRTLLLHICGKSDILKYYLNILHHWEMHLLGGKSECNMPTLISVKPWDCWQHRGVGGMECIVLSNWNLFSHSLVRSAIPPNINQLFNWHANAHQSFPLPPAPHAFSFAKPWCCHCLWKLHVAFKYVLKT